MKFVFRADASVQIGAGHVMRCLTLAGELREKSAGVTFVCRELPGNLCGLIEKKGYTVHRLPGKEQLTAGNMRRGRNAQPGRSWEEDAEQTRAVLESARGADWVIVDHYELDSRWESLLRACAKKIMVIDDLADRPHDCDLLLDQNFYQNMEARYDGLAPDHCRKLLGPGYALLRPEFRDAGKRLKGRDGSVRRILIFYGGSDPTGETAKALEAIRAINCLGIAVDVVVGGVNPQRDKLKRICSDMPFVFLYCQVDNMAELMVGADLALGAGGTANWERCFLGLPSIVTVVAQNQYETAKAAASAGALRLLGWFNEVSAENLRDAIEAALSSPASLLEMGKKAVEIMGSPLSEGNCAVIQALMEASRAEA